MKYAETGQMLYRKDQQGLFRRKSMAILVWIGLIVAAGQVLAADIPLPPVHTHRPCGASEKPRAEMSPHSF